MHQALLIFLQYEQPESLTATRNYGCHHLRLDGGIYLQEHGIFNLFKENSIVAASQLTQVIDPLHS